MVIYNRYNRYSWYCRGILKYNKICTQYSYNYIIFCLNIVSPYPQGKKGDIGESLFYNETQLRGMPGEDGYPGLTGKFKLIIHWY